MKYCMVIGCSQVKDLAPGALPAIERYRGSVYRVIRKAKRENYWLETTHIFIVSALYGLLSESTPIEYYDLRMTPRRARELQESVSRDLDYALSEAIYDEVFINMGRDYMPTLACSLQLSRMQCEGRVKEASGAIGYRLQQTREWLLTCYAHENTGLELL